MPFATKKTSKLAGLFSTLPLLTLSVKREAVNIYFKVIGLTLLGIKPEYAVSEANALIAQKIFFNTRGSTPKRVTSGGAHLRGLAPGQHSYEETLQWW